MPKIFVNKTAMPMNFPEDPSKKENKNPKTQANQMLFWFFI